VPSRTEINDLLRIQVFGTVRCNALTHVPNIPNDTDNVDDQNLIEVILLDAI